LIFRRVHQTEGAKKWRLVGGTAAKVYKHQVLDRWSATGYQLDGKHNECQYQQYVNKCSQRLSGKAEP